MRSLARSSRVALLAFAMFSAAHAQSTKPAKSGAAVPKANETTLAGLRPGRATLTQALRLLPKENLPAGSNSTQRSWTDSCRNTMLTIDLDPSGKIQVIRAGEAPPTSADCSRQLPTPWKTGRGLRLGDSASRIVVLYGQPDSKSPSSKAGQQLELWYYAFDWAGPDVPQVMEVLCTKEKDGMPGKVIEITLAAPSL